MQLNDKRLMKSLYKETIDAVNATEASEFEKALLRDDSFPTKIKTVIKRDGQTHEKYNIKKIKNAVKKAYDSVDEEIPENFWRRFNYYLKKFDDRVTNDEINVEDIQDIVEYFLMKEDQSVAKAYILYRAEHKRTREYVDEKRKWIAKYKKSSNTANSTVDDNSNVAGKNVGIINAEIHKPDNIKISRGMVMSKLKELYPDFDPKQYIRDLESHIIYKHDESTFAGAIAPYTYSPEDIIYVRYKGMTYLLSFKALYDNIETEEMLLDEEKGVYGKFPKELEIRDKNNNWTKVTRLIKKKRHRDMVNVETVSGDSIIVTDNHPLIISDDKADTVDAQNAIGNKQKISGMNLEFGDKEEIDIADALDGSESCQMIHTNDTFTLFTAPSLGKAFESVITTIAADEQLGYILGWMLTSARFEKGTGFQIHSPNENIIDEWNDDMLNLAQLIYYSTGVASNYVENKLFKIQCLKFSSPALSALMTDYFKISDWFNKRTLPYNLTQFQESFTHGIIEGIMDSMSELSEDKNSLSVFAYSYELWSQLKIIFKHYGIKFTAEIKQKETKDFPLYIITVSKSKELSDKGIFSGSSKWKQLNVVEYDSEKSDSWYEIKNVNKLDNDNKILDSMEYIYDITTESNTFLSNNIWVHNCVSISMFPFLTDGLKNLGGLSAAPKNLDSFCGLYVNLIFAIAGQFAGAVATSEFLLYFDYFARKDLGQHYYSHSDEFVEIGHLVRKLQKLTEWKVVIKSMDDIKKIAESENYSDEAKELANELISSYNDGKLKDNTRTIKSFIHQKFQQVIYSINQPAASRGLQAAFVNFSYFDKPYFESMFGSKTSFCFPDFTRPTWESLSWLQKDFMMWFNAERLKTVITFPVESFALICKNGKFEDEDSARFVAEEYARGHSFFTYISDTADSLSSCCRLKNKIQTKEFNFTNGNISVETGSKSVITLNINRITQDYSTLDTTVDFDKDPDNWYKGFKKYINKILSRVYKYHTAYNELLWDMYDSDLLTVYKAGFISLNKQYMTIGLNGVTAAAEFLGLEINDNPDYQRFCQTLFSDIKEQNSKHNGDAFGHKLTFNTEQVPAESLAIKNYNWDKADHYWIPDDINLYTSYNYKPYDDKVNVLEKMRLHGDRFIGDYLDGGAAAHINMSEHLSAEQNYKLLEYAGKVGCSYFTYNIPNSCCQDCGFITKVPIKKCPKCGSEHIDYYDRIIGYLTKISNWSEGRQIEQKKRVYETMQESGVNDLKN